jgi:hypothetical protein
MGVPVFYLVVMGIVWVISAAVASGVAPEGRSGEFFILTLLFLGPLGVGFAAVAAPRGVMPEGRTRVLCPRCAAAQYIEDDDDEFDCWRCHQHAGFSYDEWGDASTKVASAKTTAVAKTTKVKCSKCQHTQQVPVSASTFQCENCDAKLKRAKTS